MPLISSISIPSSGFTRPPHHPHHILTAETRKPPNYDYYLINSIETCLKEISLPNSQWRVCLAFLLWLPNSRAISFGDIRTKASVGPGKAVQLSEKAKRAPFQSRLRKKGFFHFGQQQINKTTMHIMMCWMCSAQISILQMPIAKAREPCDSSKPLSA